MADSRRLAPVDLDPEIVSSLPPSSLLAYVALRGTEKPQRVREITQRTGMSERTTRHALGQLVEKDVVFERQATDGDARGREYMLENGVNSGHR